MFRKEEGLEQYFKEISKIKMLSHQEEMELGENLKNGIEIEKSQDRLVQSNLRLVVKIAGNYVNRGMALMDLIEEGNLGLIQASRKFDPTRECRFSTYAIWWIKQSIRRALVDTVKTIRIPSYMVGLLEKWKHARQELFSKLNRMPCQNEIAEHLNIDEDQQALIECALQVREGCGKIISLGTDSEAVELAVEDNQGVSDDEMDKQVHLKSLGAFLCQLKERDREIIQMRYGLKDGKVWTLKDIGEIFHLSRERVRQIEQEALAKLNVLIRQSQVTMKISA